MKEIIIVLPFVSSSIFIQWTRDAYADVDGVDIVGIDEGNDPLIIYSDIEMNLPGILNRLVEAEREGYRAAIIGCFGDPGLVAARQLVSIPVSGPGESSLAVASTLGDRIVIFEPCKDFTYATEKMVHSYGYRDKVVGIHSINIPLEACASVGGEGEQEMVDISRKVVSDMCDMVMDLSAHVIIMGCIGMSGFVGSVNDMLKEKDISCPIIEPGIVSIQYLKMLLSLELNQSRQMFE